MSSTKILIVVLILIALLFVIFVVRGGFNEKPKQGNRNDAVLFSKQKKAPGWSKTINKLVSSLKPKVELKRKVYSTNSEESIGPDEKQPFRTATFHLIKGSASIEYKDRTEDAIDDLKEQECTLPNFDNDDPTRCSIVALKKGGTLTISCQGTNPCQVEVE